jgi:hypothetical protein
MLSIIRFVQALQNYRMQREPRFLEWLTEPFGTIRSPKKYYTWHWTKEVHKYWADILIELKVQEGNVSKLFLLAIRQGDVRRANFLLGHGAQITDIDPPQMVTYQLDDCTNEHLTSCLHHAISSGHDQMVDWLLTRKGRVDFSSYPPYQKAVLQKSLISEAIKTGKVKIINWLVDCGAQIECSDIAKKTYLDEALSEKDSDGKTAIIRLLIRHKIRCHFNNFKAAFLDDSSEIVRLLLEHDAVIDFPGQNHVTNLARSKVLGQLLNDATIIESQKKAALLRKHAAVPLIMQAEAENPDKSKHINRLC